MKINKHNLEIAKYCAKEAFRGFALNLLHFTKTGTLACCRFFSISVTALSVEDKTPIGYGITPNEAALFHCMLEGEESIDYDAIEPAENAPNLSRYDGKPVAFSINMDSEYLLLLAQAVIEFGGPVVRIEFTEASAPARWLATNPMGQEFEALLMPFMPCPRCGCETRSGICQNHGCEGSR